MLAPPESHAAETISQPDHLVAHDAEPKASSSFVRFLRWVAFIPAGFLGGGVVGALALLTFSAVTWLIGGSIDAPPIARLAAGAMSGYASVYCACLVAPSQCKKAPAFSVGILAVIIGAYAILVRAQAGEHFRTVEGLATVGGSVIAMFQAARGNLMKW